MSKTPSTSRSEQKKRRPHSSPPHKKRKMDDDSVHEITNTSPSFATFLPHSSTNLKSEDVVRLMIQSMEDLGFSGTAQSLRTESGIYEESEAISAFKQNVLQGNWDQVLDSIPILQVNFPPNKLCLLWAIHRHCYLEQIEKSLLSDALQTLRTHLHPLSISIDNCNGDTGEYQADLKKLTTLLVLYDQRSMKEKANWPGICHGARDQLLKEIHSTYNEAASVALYLLYKEYVSPSIMLPPGRLGVLLDQAVIAQRDKCIYHHEDGSSIPNLLENHSCKRSRIPLRHTNTQPSHDDEVWCLAFSNSGNFLASGSKDSSVIIWNSNVNEKMQIGTKYKKLVPKNGMGEREGLHKICWTKDDKLILGCTITQVILWTVDNGQAVEIFDNESSRPKRIQSVIWSPDERSFICAGLGQYITQYTLDGQEIRHWKVANVVDMDIHCPSNVLVACCQQRKINIIRLDTHSVDSIQEVSRISSVCISKSGEFVLAHLFSQEIHLWCISSKKLVTQYYHKRSLESINVFLSAVFGGQYDSFVLSGSIDGSIYMWQRNGALLEVLRGSHLKPVNCIEWNHHVNESMFASGGDDNQVIIWHT